MRSMTGFGKGTAEQDGTRVTVEISAVNSRKQADIRLSLPRELSMLDPQMRLRIAEGVSRGSLNVVVNYELSPVLRRQRLRIDRAAAAGLIENLRQLAREAGLSTDLRVSDLLTVPDLVLEEGSFPVEAVEEPVMAALAEALTGLRAMQETEGGRLRQDLSERTAGLRKLLAAIRAGTDGALRRHRDRLRERIALLGVEVPVDDERLAREVAFCAERSDINEEVVRLDSHLTQFEESLNEDGDIGRALEFLCQEMGREINTIGAKTGETEIAKAAIDFKTELNRLREQVMNVE